MKIAYVKKKFTASHLAIISTANDIVAEYMAQGYDLTLRQIYYQFVSRAIIENTIQSYKRLGSIINDARLAGLISWEAMEDRTRGVETPAHWNHPTNILNVCARQFRIDKWHNQKYRPEVLVEKDALAGIVGRVCQELDISYLSCRGYTSQSEMWRSAMRYKAFRNNGQVPIILHFGDHDPSGIDMSRDIRERVNDVFGVRVEVIRMALNMDQVQQYNPPPNPAKETDSRCSGYKDKYGDESWELDALEPSVISDLIRDKVLTYRDDDKWKEKIQEEENHRATLAKIVSKFDDIEIFLDQSEGNDDKIDEELNDEDD